MSDLTYANSKVLVSTQWAAEHLDDPNVRIVEVVMGSHASFGLPVYEAGHLPGAVVWDYEKDYLDPGQGDIVDKHNFEKQLSSQGQSTLPLEELLTSMDR